MIDDIFNTQFEYMLRCVCILKKMTRPITFEHVLYVDFICSYGKSFGFFSENLHGDNSFKFSEFPIRRQKIQESLKRLVIDGYVLVKFQKTGIKYVVSNKGQILQQSLNDDYFSNLSEMIERLKQYKESELKKIVDMRLLGEEK